jgi:DNA-binding winged helix-turn-helix (wHTH) protein
MDQAAHSAKLIRFGVFEIDLQAAELRKQGRRIKLQEQPFQILVLLLDHRGGVVGRDDLKHRLWPADTFVDFDHSLNTAVMRLREALGDSSENPRFIETIPKRGYRFIAPFEEVVVSGAENRGRDHAETPGVERTWALASKTPSVSTHAAEATSSQGRPANTRRIVQLTGIIAASAALILGLTPAGPSLGRSLRWLCFPWKTSPEIRIKTISPTA